ncbi:helix-turn-helix domain-containing protein [Nitrospira sp. CMX1]
MALEPLLTELMQLITQTPVDRLPAVMSQLAAAQSSAAARLLGNQMVPGPALQTAEKECYLTVEEVADRFHVTARWLYRNKKHLPHSQPTRKTLLFPEAALSRWFAKRRA